MKFPKDLNLEVNPNTWDSIVIHPENIEYIFKTSPYANNHIPISSTAELTKENMIQIVWSRLISKSVFTSVINW